MRVYDKRNERIDRGAGDPGDWVRYELTVTSKHGPTLRDVYDPAPMFWHFASGVVAPPRGLVDNWTGHAAGFDLPPRPELSPMELYKRQLETSHELARLAEIADRIGPYGRDVMHDLLDKHLDRLRAKREREAAQARAETA